MRDWAKGAAGLLFSCSLAAGVAPQAGSTASWQFGRAQQLLLQGRLAEALAAAQEGLKTEPRSVEGLNLLGIIDDQARHYAQAEAAFKAALAVDPRSTKTHNNLGHHYALAGEPRRAEREFRAALRLDPRNRDANYNLGLVLLARNDARGAIARLSRVQPRDASASLSLVQAYLGAGDRGRALALAQTLSNAAPRDPRLHFSLGVVLAAGRQYAEAIRELARADALRPGTFEILHNLGEAYLRNENYSQAEATLSRALALKPDSVGTMYLLARAETERRHYLDALDLLLRARQRDPQNPDVLFLMGRISMIQNYYEDAIPVLEEGVRVAPRRPDLRAALGESYFTSGSVDQALAQFKILIGLDPSASSYAFMGLAYRHLGRFDEAKKYFNEGLAREPGNATCLYNLGYIASRQGNYAEAESYLKAALKSKPDYSEALYELASVKMVEKRYAEAVPLLRESAKGLLRPAEAYYKLATAERNLHQMDAAARDIQVFETLSKDQSGGPYPFQHLFDALNQRLGLAPRERAQADLADLQQQVAQHPDQPRSLYLLAEAYLKLGRADAARRSIAQLDQLSGGDYRTALGVGTLCARYRLYPEAIRHFQTALAANPNSDEAQYDLADAYFQLRDYARALEALEHVSEAARQDESYLSLSGDILAHLGRMRDAERAFEQAVRQSPDNDQVLLSLALARMQAGELDAAEKALRQGLARIPDSGRLYWGLGVLAAVRGHALEAEQNLAHAEQLLPEWPGTYSALGIFYYETGQISKARETLERYERLFPHGLLDVNRIQQTLAAASAPAGEPRGLSSEARLRFLGMALALAEQSP